MQYIAKVTRARQIGLPTVGLIEYAKAYEGDFPFMVAMREKALHVTGWIPTPAQARGIRNCMKHASEAPSHSWARGSRAAPTPGI
jgi:hypothetical protein